MKRPMLAFLCAFLAGEVLAYKMIWGIGVTAVLAVFLFGSLGAADTEDKRHSCRIFAALPFFVLAGFLVLTAGLKDPDFEEVFAEKESTKVSCRISGQISVLEERTDPDTGEEKVRIRLKNCSILCDNTLYENGIKDILVFEDEMPEAEEGNEAIVSGTILELSGATNPGEFDQKLYYRGQGISYLFYGDSWKIISTRNNPYFNFARLLRCIRKHLEDNIIRTGGSFAGIFQAMTLGEQWAVADDVKTLYQSSGIGHLMAISGMHLSLVVMSLYRLLRRKCHLSYCFCAVFCSSLAFFYCQLTGDSIGTERAAVMFAVFATGGIFGKQYDLPSAGAFGALLILIREPLLLFSVSFQLSFGAVLSISLLLPVLEKKTGKRFLNAENRVLKALFPGLSITIGTLPVTLYWFFQYPVLSVLLNLVILPLFPVIAISGLFAGIFGGILPQPVMLLLFPAKILLNLYEWAAALSLKFPWSLWLAGRPHVLQIFLYYIALYLLLKRGKKVLLAFLPVLLIHISLPGLHMTFLDVGQGDSCYIEASDGTKLLIDGGSSDHSNIGENVILPFLKSQAVSAVDYAIISHGDSDHVNGIEEMIEAGKIRNLILPENQCGYQELLQEVLELANENSVPVYYMSAGDTVELGKTTVKCLWPEKDTDGSSENEASMVLWISYKQKNFLFTGDLEGEGETALTEILRKSELPEQFDILKVQHHGSAYAGYAPILSLVNPKLSVISCGLYNSYGHPAKETLDRLEKTGTDIYRTDKNGALSLRFY